MANPVADDAPEGTHEMETASRNISPTENVGLRIEMQDLKSCDYCRQPLCSCSSKMAAKTNQHYVPQQYFRFFSEDKKSICLINRRNGTFIAEAPIKGQASKRYFYGDAAIEEKLTEMESACLKVIARCSVENRVDWLDAESYDMLLRAIMLQRTRTQTARSAILPSFQRYADIHLQIAINKSEKLTEEERNSLISENFGVDISPTFAQGILIGIGVQHADHLSHLQPILFHNKTNRPFMFGDAPVAFINPLMRLVKHRGALGMKSPGLIVLYPLSESSTIALIDSSVYNFLGTTKPSGNYFLEHSIRSLGDVFAFNSIQLQQAESALYFGKKKWEAYARWLWQDHVKILNKGRAGFHETEVKFDINDDTKFGSSMMHDYEEQIPRIPNFSFLKYEPIKEEEKDFLHKLNSFQARPESSN